MVEFDLDKVEALAAQGLTKDQIALALGVNRSTLFKKQKEDKDFSDAIKRGKAKGIAKVSNALFQSATSGNVTAQIFFLKNRDPEEWSDKQQADLRGTFELKWLP